VPGPLVPTLLAAGFLPGAADGDAIVAMLDAATAVPVIEHFGIATHVVIVSDNGLFLLPAAGLAAVPVEIPLDPLTPVAVVTGGAAEGGAAGDGAAGEGLAGSAAATAAVAAAIARATPVGTAADALAWRQRGAVLTAALQVGIAQGGLDLGVRYVKEREQFGRVVGGFQAVKHLLAESLVRVELARAAVLSAAVTLDDPASGDPSAGGTSAGGTSAGGTSAGDTASADYTALSDYTASADYTALANYTAAAASAAKVLADDAATAGGRTCVQVHGGMGFTWEVLAHLYLKRAWVHETSFGTTAEHEAFLAGCLDQPPAVD
jgi:hypothetical protein